MQKLNMEYISTMPHFVVSSCLSMLVNGLKPYPINGHPGHILVWRLQRVSLQGILMHELVSQISIHTLHHGVPVQLRSVESRTLQGKCREK